MKKEIFLLLVLAGLAIGISYAQTINVRAGYIARANLYAESSTWKWGGIIGYLTPGTLDESPAPFMVHSVTGGIIDMVNISASNLKDGKHYFAALSQFPGAINSTYKIDVSKIRNITLQDLEEFGLFNETNFPVFHPNYYQQSDNPKATFCCKNETILISEKPFQPYVIWLKQGVRYYLLKYEYNATLSLPLFLVNLSDYTCYDFSTCNFEFMLPAEETYNFYVLPREIAFEIIVYIDGVETTTISKTGLPYNITCLVRDIYTHEPIPNKTVIIFEDNGNNIFSPLPLSSVTSRAMSMQVSDANGTVQFIIAPTVTQTEASSYSLNIGLYSGEGLITNTKSLQIIDTELTGGKKQISPTELLDNSKATVVTMIQIEDSVYYWAKQKKANKYTVFVKTDGTYTIRNESDGLYYSSAILQTGAVNYINVILQDADSGTQIQGYVKPEEKKGFLVMNPTYNPPVVGYKNHTHQVFYIPTGTGFVITPTKMGSANSEVKLYIYDSNYYPVTQIPFYVSKETSIPGSAQFYQNDDMQAKIVKTIQVIDTLYYAYW